jgi:hypothetical protein
MTLHNGLSSLMCRPWYICPETESKSLLEKHLQFKRPNAVLCAMYRQPATRNRKWDNISIKGKKGKVIPVRER